MKCEQDVCTKPDNRRCSRRLPAIGEKTSVENIPGRSCSMHFSCSCRRQKYHIYGASVTSEATLCLRNYLWYYVGRQSVEEDPGEDLACYRKKKDSFIVPTVCSITFLIDSYNASILPCLWSEPTSQALVISWCSLLNRLSPPCFHTSVGIPSPPGALSSFRPAIALVISAMVGISLRHVLVMRCGMLPRAS